MHSIFSGLIDKTGDCKQSDLGGFQRQRSSSFFGVTIFIWNRDYFFSLIMSYFERKTSILGIANGYEEHIPLSPPFIIICNDYTHLSIGEQSIYLPTTKNSQDTKRARRVLKELRSKASNKIVSPFFWRFYLSCYQFPAGRLAGNEIF